MTVNLQQNMIQTLVLDYNDTNVIGLIRRTRLMAVAFKYHVNDHKNKIGIEYRY